MLRDIDGIKMGPFGSALTLDSLSEAGYRVYGQENVMQKDFSCGQRFLSEDRYAELFAYGVRPGDVLLTMMGSAGRCAVVPDGIEPGIMDSHLVRLRLDHASFDSRFLARVIDDAPYVRAQFDAMAKGSIMAGLNSSLVKNLLLCQPPVAEQKIIVELLDRATEVIDALIVKKQQLIELLQEKRTALISHAVTKGLDPHVRMRDSGIAILATIPAAWRVLPLRRVLERVKQGWSPECDERPAAEGAWGVLKTSCINGGAFDEMQNKSLPADRPPQPDLEVKAGDLLMCRASGSGDLVGVTVLVDACRPRLTFPDLMFRLVLDRHQAHPPYISYVLNSLPLRAQIERELSGSVGLARKFRQSKVPSLVVPLPPLDEQVRIADATQRRAAEIDGLIASVEAAVDQIREYRSALITAAVTGQIDVRTYRRDPEEALETS